METILSIFSKTDLFTITASLVLFVAAQPIC